MITRAQLMNWYACTQKIVDIVEEYNSEYGRSYPELNEISKQLEKELNEIEKEILSD